MSDYLSDLSGGLEYHDPNNGGVMFEDEPENEVEQVDRQEWPLLICEILDTVPVDKMLPMLGAHPEFDPMMDEVFALVWAGRRGRWAKLNSRINAYFEHVAAHQFRQAPRAKKRLTPYKNAWAGTRGNPNSRRKK